MNTPSSPAAHRIQRIRHTMRAGSVTGAVARPGVQPSASALTQFGRVRGTVWGALALVIVIAIVVPVGVYYQEATSALSAHVCLWPATPRADAPARLLIILAPGRDRADAQTPQAQAQAEWDMQSMAMGAQRAVASGSAAAGAFIVPLSLSMAGPWRAQVSVQAPGRPGWSGHVDFTALAAVSGAASAVAVPSVSRMLLACQAKGATT